MQVLIDQTNNKESADSRLVIAKIIANYFVQFNNSSSSNRATLSFPYNKKWTLFCRVSKGLKGITKAPKFNMFTLQNTDFSLSLIVVEGLSVAEGSFTALMKINRQCLIINHFEDLYLDMGTEEGSENEYTSSDDVCISTLTDNLSL